MALFRWIILLCGLTLFVVLVWTTGVQTLWRDLVSLGWAIVPYLALTGVENVFHTLSSRWCFSREHRRAIPLWRLFLVYQTGYALNLVTPTAEIGGEVARGVVFEKYVPGSEAASAVIINKFAYSIARMIIAAALTGFTVLAFPLATLDAWLIGLGSVLTTLALLAFAFVQARGLFGPVLRKLAWFTGRRGQEWVEKNVGELDQRLRNYYRYNRFDLYVAVVWDLAGFAVGTLQKWYLMALLLPAAGVEWNHAIAVWGITTLLDMIFFFVTGGMGVQEGSHKLAFEAVRLPGAQGVSLSIASRIDQVFWIAVGLAAYMVEMTAKKRLRPDEAAHR
jgi:hypothetical protein